MPRPHHSTRAETRWAVRIIPLFIVAILGVATYSVVARLCSKFESGSESLEMVDERKEGKKEEKKNQILTRLFLFFPSWLPLQSETSVRRCHDVPRPLFPILPVNGCGLSTNILYNPTKPGPRALASPRANRTRSRREAAKAKTQAQPRCRRECLHPSRPKPGQPGAGSLLQQGRFRVRGRRPS